MQNFVKIGEKFYLNLFGCAQWSIQVQKNFFSDFDEILHVYSQNDGDSEFQKIF